MYCQTSGCEEEIVDKGSCIHVITGSTRVCRGAIPISAGWGCEMEKKDGYLMCIGWVSVPKTEEQGAFVRWGDVREQWEARLSRMHAGKNTSIPLCSVAVNFPLPRVHCSLPGREVTASSSFKIQECENRYTHLRNQIAKAKSKKKTHP